MCQHFRFESLANILNSVVNSRDDEAVKHDDDRGNGELPEGDGNRVSREEITDGPSSVSSEVRRAWYMQTVWDPQEVAGTYSGQKGATPGGFPELRSAMWYVWWEYEVNSG